MVEKDTERAVVTCVCGREAERRVTEVEWKREEVDAKLSEGDWKWKDERKKMGRCVRKTEA